MQDGSIHPHWVEFLWAFSNLCLTISSSVNYLIYMSFRKNCQSAQVICLTKMFKQNQSDSTKLLWMGSTRQIPSRRSPQPRSPLNLSPPSRSRSGSPENNSSLRRRNTTRSSRKRCESEQVINMTKMSKKIRSDSIPMFSTGSTRQLDRESLLSMTSLRRRKSSHSTLHTKLSQTTLVAFN